MPTTEPPRAIGPGKACVELGFKYGNTTVNYRINMIIFENGRQRLKSFSLSVSDKNIIFISVFSVFVFIFVYTRISVKSRKRFPVIENFRFCFQPQSHPISIRKTEIQVVLKIQRGEELDEGQLATRSRTCFRTETKARPRSKNPDSFSVRTRSMAVIQIQPIRAHMIITSLGSTKAIQQTIV